MLCGTGVVSENIKDAPIKTFVFSVFIKCFSPKISRESRRGEAKKYINNPFVLSFHHVLIAFWI